MSAQALFEKIVKNYNPEIRKIAYEVRALILDIFPETVEVPWVIQKIIGYGVGPKKMSEHFCWIQPNKAHVNLGFNVGANLPDPDRLLEGTGKLFRHIKIKSSLELKNPCVRKLIEGAIQERLQAIKK